MNEAIQIGCAFGAKSFGFLISNFEFFIWISLAGDLSRDLARRLFVDPPLIVVVQHLAGHFLVVV